jgi:NDP-sugar pyrophosphorylase family protein
VYVSSFGFAAGIAMVSAHTYICLVATITTFDWVQVGQQLHLSSLIKRAPAELATGDHIRGAVIIDKTAQLGAGCLIGPDVSIGPDCIIGDGVRLANCVIMKGCTVRLVVFILTLKVSASA